MGLRIKSRSLAVLRPMATLMMVFAIVAQPMYGALAAQYVSAMNEEAPAAEESSRLSAASSVASAIPTATGVDASYTQAVEAGVAYTGIYTEFTIQAGLDQVVERLEVKTTHSDTSHTRSMIATDAHLGRVNAGISTTGSFSTGGTIVVTGARTSGSWEQLGAWTATTDPTSVEVWVTLAGQAPVMVGSDASVRPNGATAQEVLPKLAITKAGYNKTADYSGIYVGFDAKSVANVTNLKLVAHKSNGAEYHVEATSSLLDVINAKVGSKQQTSTGGTIVVTGARTSGSWTNQTGTWDGAARLRTSDPIELRLTLADGQVVRVYTSTVVNDGATADDVFVDQIPPADTAAPEILSISPVANSAVKETQEFVVHATDESGVEKIALYIWREDNTKAKEVALKQDTEDEAQWTGSVDTAALGNGEYQLGLRVVALDGTNKVKLYNNRKESHQFTIDNANPVVRNVKLSDGVINGDEIKKNKLPTLSADVDGTGSNVDRAEYRIHTAAGEKIDGFNWVLMDAADESFDQKNELVKKVLDVNGLADGDYLVRVRAFDAADNKKSGNDIQFRVDTKQATVTIDTPQDGTPISGTEKFSLTVEDDYGVSKVAMYVNKDGTKVREFALKQSGDTWYYNVDTTSLAGDGEYKISFRAVDNSGNVTYVNNRLDSYSVTVDNTAPDVQVVGHTASENSITISGVTDSPDRPVTVTLGGQVATVNPEEDGAWIVIFEGLNPGAVYTYVIQSADVAGNTFTSPEAGEEMLRAETSASIPEEKPKPESPPAAGPAGGQPGTTQGGNSPTGGAPIVTVSGESIDGAATPLLVAALTAPTFAVAGPVAADDAAVLGDQDVLGTTDTSAPNATVDGDVDGAPADDTSGMAWYWWVLIAIVGLGAAWWLIAALRKKIGEDE